MKELWPITGNLYSLTTPAGTEVDGKCNSYHYDYDISRDYYWETAELGARLLMAWWYFPKLYARYGIVSTKLHCLLVLPPQNFPNISCSASTFCPLASKLCLLFALLASFSQPVDMATGETKKRNDQAPNTDNGQTMLARIAGPLSQTTSCRKI